MLRRRFLTVSACTALAGCSHAKSNARYEELRANEQPLRSDFNEDANKVRILMLVSPT